MSNLLDYARSELDRAFPDKEDEIQQYGIRDILELIKVFSDQGHSGLSGPYVLAYFNRLVKFKPIGPLTGEDDEWGNPDNTEKHTQQNKRCFSVFRNNFDNSTAYDIKGQVFIDKDGFRYTDCDSWVSVTFPYEVPDKPEIVDERRNVVEEDNENGKSH